MKSNQTNKKDNTSFLRNKCFILCFTFLDKLSNPSGSYGLSNKLL